MKRIFLYAAIAAILGGCGTTTVVMPDGTKMSEAIYAHTLSVKAAETIANKAASCDAAVTPVDAPLPTTELGKAIDALRTLGGLAVCGQRVAGGGGSQVPVYQAPPTIIDRAAQLAPLLLGLGQLVVGDRANARQTEASVLVADISARREVGIVQAATGSNERIATGGFVAVGTVAQTGFNALGAVAQTGFNAVSSTAQSGFNALASAAESASAANILNTQAWAGAMAALPPTIQAGGSVTQAGGAIDLSTNGANRVTGNRNETARNILCQAQGGNGAPATSGSQSAVGGATNPLNPLFNPLIIGGRAAPVSNNCGGG